MIHRIASPDDPRLDSYRFIGDPAWLRDHGLFAAEGRLVVERLVDLGGFAIESVLVNPAAHQALADRLAPLAVDVYVSGDAGFTAITGFNFHRGCLALVRRAPPRAPADLLAAGALLALDGVSNPDNIGGLFRTAAALGAGGILLGPGSGDPWYRKSIRTSMGAVLRLPFATVADWPSTLAVFRRAGFAVVALTPHADAVPLERFARGVNHEDRLVVLVGAEGAGLGDAALGCADARVRIPIDSAIDSLNVTVAAGIALSRLRRGQTSG